MEPRSAQTEEAVAAVLRRDHRIGDSDAATLARVVSSVMFLSTAMSLNITWSVEELMHDGVLTDHGRLR
jgi:hypothetical protein